MIQTPKIEENVNLAKLTTMNLGGNARFFATAQKNEDIIFLVDFAKQNQLPIFILGGGSNTLVHDEGFKGLVIKNEILGRKILHEDNRSVEFELGAGEDWNSFVKFAVLQEGLSGIEAMVSVPGTVGALPVQNVGAYGQEIADVFISLNALNLEKGVFEELSKEDCEFSYRDSIFRRSAAGKYFITSIKIKLSKLPPKGPFYAGVETYFQNNNIPTDNITAAQILNAVAKIRADKLPDPKLIPSAGSFFKNAIISAKQADGLKDAYGDKIPLFDLNDGRYKISTGWLIDKAGLKDVELHGMCPHFKNALVLTNVSARNFNDLALAREEIKSIVKGKFGIEIEQEPLEI